MRRVLAALAVALAACANLPDISSGTCGNGVLDDKEDCDSGDPNCVACQIACTHPTGDPTPLPTCELDGEVVPGYRCGADDRCHAPSGVFAAEQTAFDFAVSNGEGGDLDGDGIHDVIGFSDINIDVHFGDLTGALASESSTIVPFANTNPVLRRVRIPGSLAEKVDILLPTPDGIAAYTAEDKQIVPFPFATDPRDFAMCDALAPPNEPVGLFAINKRDIAIVSRNATTKVLSVSTMDVTGTHCNTHDVCGLELHDGDALRFDSYPGNAPSEAMVAFSLLRPPADQMPAQAGACVLATAPSAGPPVFLTQRGPFPIGFPYPATLLRTRATDSCPSLVATSADGTTIEQWPAALDPGGHCTVAPAAKDMPFTDAARPVARLALDPPVVGQAPDALVMATFNGMNEGVGDVYLVDDTTLQLGYHSQRALYPVLSGDVDGDGRIDGIGASALRFSSADIDVLYRTTAPGSSFLSYRIPTRTSPRFVEVGDFDGNGITDIVYVETVGGHDELMVAYGTKDRPTAPVAITSFTHVAGLAVVDVPDSVDRFGGLLDDLLVVDQDADGKAQVTLFHGNPQRSMLAFFDPGIQRNRNELVSIVQGNFSPEPGSDGFPHDLVAFERALPGGPTGMSAAAAMWLVEGEDAGEAVTAATSHATALTGDDCSNVALCLQTAHYLPWPIGDGATTRDVVIAVDEAQDNTSPRHVVTFDPKDPTITMRPASSDVITAMPSDLAVNSLFAADLDGDGKNELWIALSAAPGAPGLDTAKLLRCDVDAATALVSSCADVSPIANAALPHPNGLDWHCGYAYASDLEPVNRRHPAPPRKGTDIVALCYLGPLGMMPTSAIVRLHTGDGGGIEAQPLSGVLSAAAVAGADLDGDALEDLVMIALSAQGLATLHIFPQCQASDAECIAHGLSSQVVTP